jgi:hypothetical protein
MRIRIAGNQPWVAKLCSWGTGEHRDLKGSSMAAFNRWLIFDVQQPVKFFQDLSVHP